MPKKPPQKRLGRGLESLISSIRIDPVPVNADQNNLPDGPIVDRLDPALLSPNPWQPRRLGTTEELDALTQSIKQSGMIQPIAVRRSGDRFEIIAGERRWRAAKAAGLDRVPVLIRDADDQEMVELALIENIQREDLNAIDRAKAYQQYRDRFNLTTDDIARLLAENRTTVTNYLRLLELDDDTQTLVADRRLSMGHARTLISVRDARERRRLAGRAVEQDLSVRALEKLVRDTLRPPSDGPAKLDRKSPHIRDLEARFEQRLGTKVSIAPSRKPNRGRITIDYFTLDDFDRIAELLGIELHK